MSKIATRAFCAFIFSLFITTVIAQQPRPDTTRPVLPNVSPLNLGRTTSGPRPYKDVITSKAITDKGLFDVHRIDDKFYFEIGDSVLGRDLLVVNRISKAGTGMRSGMVGYAGDQIGQNVIRFEKGPNNKIFMRSISYAEYAKDSTSPMFTAVNNSNIQAIAAAFEIRAFSKDSTGYVIDVTDYINSDNEILYFSSSAKSTMRVGAQQSDKSYIETVHSYPMNIEISVVKTYSRGGGATITGGTTQARPSGPSGGNVTMQLNSSIVLLPKNPMQPRYFDARVGYFAVGYTDFDANPQGVEDITMIKRWRLDPKPADMDKYRRGELVEPQKPIVFYIDPATPKKWVPYLIQGVNDWQKAFEKAGFKNAIIAKTAPTKQEDPEWSLEDARYSAIVYKPSIVANASGPSISDPRSGEIMESHINWFHNVMELIHDWYFIQCAAVDTGARKMVFDDELMGQLIRFVSSHEVGHTLGLRHNFGSSSTIPVDSLRNKKWVEANGHTPSIMDYARFNYVAQPEDKISRAGLFPRIGVYDDWAIEWGYKLFPQYKNADDEQTYLNNWVIQKLKNKKLWFGTESNPDDPRSQREQVGDDAMKGSMYGIKNLQRILPNLIEWTQQPNKDYSDLRKMYTELTDQFTMYVGHVAKYIGGIEETPRTVEEKAPVYEIVSKAKQREAVAFLNKELFTTPSWLLSNAIFDRTGANPISSVGNIQNNMLNTIMATRTLSKLIDAEATKGNEAYNIVDLFSDLEKGLWSELSTHRNIDVYRRNLQKLYVNNLASIVNQPQRNSATASVIIVLGAGSTTSSDQSDIRSVARANLVSLANKIKGAQASFSDPMSRYHLQDVLSRISKALENKD